MSGTGELTGIKKRIIPFSPPDISETEIKEVTEAMRSGWIIRDAKNQRVGEKTG